MCSTSGEAIGVCTWPRQARGVRVGVPAPRRVPAVQVRQLDAEHRRLQRIEPRVGAGDRMVILHALAVVAQQPQLRRPRGRRWS